MSQKPHQKPAQLATKPPAPAAPPAKPTTHHPAKSAPLESEKLTHFSRGSGGQTALNNDRSFANESIKPTVALNTKDDLKPPPPKK